MDRKEWLKYRQGGIGSSDAAAVLGISPYSTAFEVYESKVGEVKDEVGNFITDIGNKFEPMIRRVVEEENFERFPAAMVRHEKFPFLMASLDGENETKDIICEIKVMGEGPWRAAKEKKEIPEHYKAQMNHQLGVSGAKKCIFAALLYEKGMKEVDPQKVVMIDFYPNQQVIADQMKKIIDFWHEHVVARVPPKDEKKYETLSKTKDLTEAFENWKKLNRESALLDGKIKNARDKILSAVNESGFKRVEFEGVRIRQEHKKSPIDYTKIPAVAGMTEEEFEKYRGPGAYTWKVELLKEKKETK